MLHWDGRDLTVHADLSGLVDDRCNDMVVDSHGNVYVGTYPSPPDFQGVVVHVAPDGEARIAADGMRFPNGSVVTDDDQTLIVAESMGHRFTRFTIEVDGSLSGRSVHASTKPDVPDGICLDLEGSIWSAFPMAHEFRRIASDGAILDSIPMGDRLAIACALGGPDMRTLFLLLSLVLPGPDIVGTRTARLHAIDVEVAGTGSP